MKKLIITLLVAIVITSCKETKKNTLEQSSESADSKEVTINKKNSFIKIEFEEGPLKGTHTFKINSQEITSNFGVRIDKTGFVDINGGTVFNSNGDRLSSFNRLLATSIKKGSNSPYAKDCGGMIFHDRDNSQSAYNKIYVNFTDCTSTQITDLTSWKENAPYRQRGISGNFKDVASLEVNTDDGKTITVESPVKISFGLLQKELVK